jgi:hypothetical protein
MFGQFLSRFRSSPCPILHQQWERLCAETVRRHHERPVRPLAGFQARSSQTQATRLMAGRASRNGYGESWGHDMNDMENQTMDSQEAAIALFLENNDPDQLTDILVAALDDALRLLQEDAARDTLH